jgi:hypothetical protein
VTTKAPVRVPWREIFVLGAYAAATLILTLAHEPWRDEADAWLAARDLPLSGVFSWTRNAGTPFLWYLVLLPFARGGMPYASMAIVHWVIAIAAAAVFLRAAPWSLPRKALFLFSFYPLYHYAAIARSYSLGILLTFAALALHQRRHERLVAYAACIALLFNTNIHSAGPAGALTLMFFVEVLRAHRRSLRHWMALLVMGSGLLLAFVQLYTPGPLVPQNVTVAPPEYSLFFESIAAAFVPGAEGTLVRSWALALLVAVAASVRRNATALAMLTITIGLLAFLFTHVWLGGYRHYGLMLIAVVAALWLGSDSRSRARPAVTAMLGISLLLSLPAGYRAVRDELTKSYSGAGEMARYIDSHGLAGRVIAAHPPAQTEAVLAHLPPRQFRYAALGRDGSYLQWDVANRKATARSANVAAEAAVKQLGPGRWLFLSAVQPLTAPERHGLTLLYATTGPLITPRDASRIPNDERYWLYEHR